MIKHSVPNYLKVGAFCIGIFIFILACKEQSRGQNSDTITAGEISVYVDETVQSLVEGQVEVFESQYKAKINLTAKPESAVVNDLITGKTNMAVLTRKLTPEEEVYFKNKKVKARVSHFASDAIVFIRNKSVTDTLLDLDQVYNLLHGKSSTIKNLVFDNPNSSVISYLNRWAKIEKMPTQGIFSLNSTKEVLEFVSKNQDAIGVIGMDAIAEPYPEWQSLIENVRPLAIRNVKNGANNKVYYLPNQANLGAGLYPLKRSIYVLNYQGYAGLGTGFASFVVGDVGQRIVLRSNLLPISIPPRNIVTRKNINLK